MLLEVDLPDIALLLTALSLHVGEVARSSYLSSNLCRLHANVCRGGELVKEFGASTIGFVWGELYRLGCICQGVRKSGRPLVIPNEKPDLWGQLISAFF
jgi:hypothetical protein